MVDVNEFADDDPLDYLEILRDTTARKVGTSGRFYLSITSSQHVSYHRLGLLRIFIVTPKIRVVIVRPVHRLLRVSSIIIRML